ncbi:site-specific integrase [Sunxiuqinia indica]|uniref:site-specific integrase n=1 Tax=Sunxiuqinia indica TaxID=2692584 RepID=UPI00135CC823|nr:site-specific integrase [Sunxiuqinia indica]
MRVTVNFSLKRSKSRADGKCPVYVRCTMDGQRFELSTGLFIIPDFWDDKVQQIKGKNEESKTLNKRLDKLATKIQDAFNVLDSTMDEFTIIDLKDKVLGRRKSTGLMDIFNYTVRDVESKVGVDYSKGTYSHYKTTRDRLGEFVLQKFKRSEIPVSMVNLDFIYSLDTYLKIKYDLKPNSVLTYHKHLNKALKNPLALKSNIENPYEIFTPTRNKTNRDYLTLREVETLRKKPLKTFRLSLVRDIFVFACYTGLAYAELEGLSFDNIYQGDDGNDWIIDDRSKTENRFRVPLLPEAKQILKKYEYYSENNTERKLLPIRSNQKMNEYLKELADICGITKNLSMHVARHTFATSVTLANGVPIETVSKMLGHTSIKTTQIYARIVDSKISKDMEKIIDILQKDA